MEDPSALLPSSVASTAAHFQSQLADAARFLPFWRIATFSSLVLC